MGCMISIGFVRTNFSKAWRIEFICSPSSSLLECLFWPSLHVCIHTHLYTWPRWFGSVLKQHGGWRNQQHWRISSALVNGWPLGLNPWRKGENEDLEWDFSEDRVFGMGDGKNSSRNWKALSFVPETNHPVPDGIWTIQQPHLMLCAAYLEVQFQLSRDFTVVLGLERLASGKRSHNYGNITIFRG